MNGLAINENSRSAEGTSISASATFTRTGSFVFFSPLPHDVSRQRQKIHNEKLVVVILFYISYVVNGTKVTERRKKNRNLISEAEKERAKTEKEKMKI
ncbi:hypothetical protein F050043D4_15020 [Bacteroides thetaiotaomicron]